MAENSENPGEEFKPSKWRQIIAAAGATNGAFALGAVLAWPSPSLPELIEKKSFGEIGGGQASWIASLAILGAALAAIPTGYCMEKVGRKKTMMILSLPLFLGWMVIVFADSVRMLYMGRFVTGFFAGACSLVVPAYLSEIASDKHRGQICSLFTTQVVHGILFVYIHGVIVDWEKLSVASSGSAIVLIIFMHFMPESPVYLLSKGKTTEATAALTWLRKAKDKSQIEPELKAMEMAVEEQGREEVLKWSQMDRSVWHPLGISVAMMFFQQWSGLMVAITYTADIFATAGSTLSPNTSAIIVGVGQLIGVSVSGFFIDRLGRRILIIGSCLAVICCWIPMGYVFWAKAHNNGVTPDNLRLVPLIALVAFMFLFSLGIGPIAWMLPAELLPSNVRGRVGAIAIAINWLAAFVLVKVYDSLAHLIGIHSCFWLFAALSLAGAIFTYLFLPETKGRSQEEIQAYFEDHPTGRKSRIFFVQSLKK